MIHLRSRRFVSERTCFREKGHSVEFKDALLAMAERTRFASESELNEVRDAIITTLTVPEPADTNTDNVVSLNADADDTKK